MSIDRRRLLAGGVALAPLALLSAATARGELVTQDPSTDPAGAGADPQLFVSVTDHGAVGDGQADDTEAVRAAVQQVLAGRRDDGQLTRALILPAGVYRVTKPDALLGSPGDGSSDQVRGLTIQGVGKRSTEVLFDSPAKASDDPFDNNLMTAANRLRGLRVSGLSFRSTNPNQSWLYCWSRDGDDASLRVPAHGVGGNQDFVLQDVEWRGPWKRVIGLDGDQQSNLNSEWAFYNCHASNTTSFADAFLHSGMSPQFKQQDQFLNYWFFACKFEYGSGTLLRLDKGGFVNVYGGSWIAGINDDKPATFFAMAPDTHVDSVQNLLVSGTRFELRHSGVRLLDSGWYGPTAHLTFLNVSDGSQAFRDWAAQAQTVLLRPRDGRLPTVKFLNSELMGYHQVQGATAGAGKVVYDGCNFSNVSSGGVGPQGFLRYEGAAPSHRFVDCYGVPDSAG